MKLKNLLDTLQESSQQMVDGDFWYNTALGKIIEVKPRYNHLDMIRDYPEHFHIDLDNTDHLDKEQILELVKRHHWVSISAIDGIAEVYGLHHKDILNTIKKLHNDHSLSRVMATFGDNWFSLDGPEKVQQYIQNGLTNINNVSEDEQDDRHAVAAAETGFWGRAGAGAMIMARSTGRVFLPLRSPLVMEPNTWGLWGGAIDSGENPKVAAMREIREETGQSFPNLEMMLLYVFEDKKSGFKYYNFLALVDEEFDYNPNTEAGWETDRADWFEVGDWPSPLHFGVVELLNDSSAVNVIQQTALKFNKQQDQTNVG